MYGGSREGHSGVMIARKGEMGEGMRGKLKVNVDKCNLPWRAGDITVDLILKWLLHFKNRFHFFFTKATHAL